MSEPQDLGRGITASISSELAEELDRLVEEAPVRAHVTLTEAGSKTVMDSIEGKSAREASPGMRSLVEEVRKRRAADSTASLRAMQEEAFSCAVDHGWWDDQMTDEMEDGSRVISYVVAPKLAEKTIPEKIALIHSEVSEALEDYRSGKMETSVRADGKPEGFPSELADIVIRVLDLAGALKIDLAGEMAKKMAFNRTRSHRHGGKRC